MIDPYLDARRRARPTNRGISFVDAEPLRELRHPARCGRPAGPLPCDRRPRRARRARCVEAARRANGPTDTRPHIAHIQVIHPDDVPRFAALGVVANAQPLWACHEAQMDDLTIPFLGEERAGWQYPFASLLRSGARLAMGSDWSVSTPNPLARDGGRRDPRLSRRRATPPSRSCPSERADARGGDPGFTLGSAYVNHLDADTGTIEVGKLADLAVIDRDLVRRRTPARSATRGSSRRSSAERRFSRIPRSAASRTRDPRRMT